MIFSPKEFIELESEKLPYTTSWGFTFTEIVGKCSKCNVELSDMKQIIIEYSDFAIVRSVGVCHLCKIITTMHPIKINDKNQSFILKDGQWISLTKSWLDNVMSWFKGEVTHNSEKQSRNNF